MKDDLGRGQGEPLKRDEDPRMHRSNAPVTRPTPPSMVKKGKVVHILGYQDTTLTRRDTEDIIIADAAQGRHESNAEHIMAAPFQERADLSGDVLVQTKGRHDAQVTYAASASSLASIAVRCW